MKILLRLMLPLLAAAAVGCASKPLISDENTARIQKYWLLYLKNDPGWPEARREWLELGPAEAQGLVNLLVQELQRNAVKTRYDARGRPEPAWLKASNELAGLGERATPSLIEALALLRDETAVYPCVVTLARTARVEDIDRAFDSDEAEDEVAFQRRLVKTYSALDDPAATRRILEVLEGPYDWQVRATAADVLGGYQGPLASEVERGLKQALNDEDDFVASKAESALKTMAGKK